MSENQGFAWYSFSDLYVPVLSHTVSSSEWLGSIFLHLFMCGSLSKQVQPSTTIFFEIFNRHKTMLFCCMENFIGVNRKIRKFSSISFCSKSHIIILMSLRNFYQLCCFVSIAIDLNFEKWCTDVFKTKMNSYL